MNILLKEILDQLEKSNFVQVSGKGQSFSNLEKVKWQLMDLGIKADIVEDLKELFIIAKKSQ